MALAPEYGSQAFIAISVPREKERGHVRPPKGRSPWNSQMSAEDGNNLVLESTSNRPVLKRMSDDFALAL
jgi:hypothetical protein